MELSMMLDYAGDPRRAADGAAALEAAGLDAPWVAEAWDFDSPTIMGYLAARLSGRKRDAAAAVPDEFCELMTLCGPEGYVRERIEAFREAGVTMLNVTPVGPEPARLIETVKNWL
ncbi:hypothetical protein [Streptomyces sp. NPDC058623]|uniref:hypothetical protein n=1 Tax=Streptomyces sp. NPDC058623 TaxID=3346563 RepID=UPI00364FA17A